MGASEPILIWGAGAIGGTLGAYWARAGVPVLLVDVVAEHVQACRTTGFQNLITFDMGGTSCDVALIKDGAAHVVAKCTPKLCE